jgi:hypothetical protein
MRPERLFNNLLVRANSMSFNKYSADIADIILTPTTELYRVSKGYLFN